ncbi:MAG: hypothetical protein AB7T10_06325 [bacterium]
MIKNKTIIILILFPVLIIGLEFDEKMPDNASSYETYPFFMHLYIAENPIFSENSLQSDKIFASENRCFTGSHYSFMAPLIRFDPVIETGFAKFEIPHKTSYDLSIIRDPSSTRLYSSLGKEDSISSVSSLSRLYLEGSTLIEHETDFYLDYKKFILTANVLQSKFKVLAGYGKDDWSLHIGYGNPDRILGRASFANRGFYFFSECGYNYKTNSIDAILFSKYHYSYERLHVTPQIFYDSVLVAQMGVLYRLLPSLSVYSNYSRRESLDFTEAGVKLNTGSLKTDILPLSYNGEIFGSKASLLAEYKYLMLNVNAEYFDSLTFGCLAKASVSLLGGNLTPSIIAEYKSDEVLDIFLNLKLIDADIFFGGRLFLNSKEYLVKGGLTWLFAD